MKKLLYLTLAVFIILSTILPISKSEAKQTNGRNFDQNPVKLVDQVKYNANKENSNKVQNTDLDNITSNSCAELSLDGRFTITRTLCSLKTLSKDYIQYVMYIWLALATIFLIRNGFKIVTSPDREKQIGVFKKNLWYTIVWVVLLIWFYYIVELFVSVVNIVTEW